MMGGENKPVTYMSTAWITHICCSFKIKIGVSIKCKQTLGVSQCLIQADSHDLWANHIQHVRTSDREPAKYTRNSTICSTIHTTPKITNNMQVAVKFLDSWLISRNSEKQALVCHTHIFFYCLREPGDKANHWSIELDPLLTRLEKIVVTFNWISIKQSDCTTQIWSVINNS